MRPLNIHVIATLAVIALCRVGASDTGQIIPDPGFRPESELAPKFMETVKTAKVVVYPTIVRTFEDTSFSTNSQQQVVAFVNEKKLARAVADTHVIDPGEIKGQAQYGIFQNDMAVIGKAIQARSSDTEYHLVLECLLAPRRPEGYLMFGIHCYILDSQGQNAFSFLLNSHHQSFVDAHMESAAATDQARDALVYQATKVGLAALAEQIEHTTASNKDE